MEALREEEYRKFKIKIFQDEDARSPRDDDNLGTMLCKHRNYDLGDAKASKEMDHDEIKAFAARDDVISIPLYLLDHSGLWMRTGRFACDAGGWDTSMVGWITVTFEKIREEYKVKKIFEKLKKKVRDILEQEVKTYSEYLEGGVYGYVVEDGDENHMDSCWGFFGDYDGEPVKQAKEFIDAWHKSECFKGVAI